MAKGGGIENKKFEDDMYSVVEHIKSGYGWIDPEYVQDTWENISDIDFKDVKIKVYKKLISQGLLYNAHSDMRNAEKPGEKINSIQELGIKETMADGGVINSDVFDKLKKGDNIHVIYPRGRDSVEKELVVKSKNLVGKGKSYESEKITFTDVSNPNGVNFFAYKRKSGFVGFAQGDSALYDVKIKEKMAKGGKTQGYDDREDERLGMEYGKIKSKYLNSTKARRDDARFEERMNDGGTLYTDGYMVDIYGIKDGKKVKINERPINVKYADKFVKEQGIEKYYKEITMTFLGKMADGGMMAEGGEVNGDNMEMVVSQIKAIKHHAEELSKIVTPSTPIEAWVVAKIERSETDLSDVTHYLDGLKMKLGGKISSSTHRLNR
jgi:hypothetical protein